jgi:glycerophosphoryl diester phosphodiesterase
MGHPIGVRSLPLRHHPFIDQPVPIAIAHRGGREEAPTVNEEPRMLELLELGVDGIITDRPRLLRDVLAARPGT